MPVLHVPSLGKAPPRPSTGPLLGLHQIQQAPSSVSALGYMRGGKPLGRTGTRVPSSGNRGGSPAPSSEAPQPQGHQIASTGGGHLLGRATVHGSPFCLARPAGPPANTITKKRSEAHLGGQKRKYLHQPNCRHTPTLAPQTPGVLRQPPCASA